MKAVRGIHVTLGEYHLKQKEPYPSQEFRVTRAAVHPKFQFSPAADRSVWLRDAAAAVGQRRRPRRRTTKTNANSTVYE